MGRGVLGARLRGHDSYAPGGGGRHDEQRPGGDGEEEPAHVVPLSVDVVETDTPRTRRLDHRPVVGSVRGGSSPNVPAAT